MPINQLYGGVKMLGWIKKVLGITHFSIDLYCQRCFRHQKVYIKKGIDPEGKDYFCGNCGRYDTITFGTSVGGWKQYYIN